MAENGPVDEPVWIGIDAGTQSVRVQAVTAGGTATLLLAASDGMQVQWMLDPSRDMAGHVEYLWSLLKAVA